MNQYAQVGALQDVRSDLTKLKGVLFYKVLDDLHDHLYNKGQYRYYPVSISVLKFLNVLY